MEQSKQEAKFIAKIRHVVYRAKDLEVMANFFVNAFGMTIVHRRPNGGIELSDGTLNLSVLPLRSPGQRYGIEHIGFMVEDETEACRRLEAAGGRKIGTTVDPFQVKFHGPEGIEVETGEWRGAQPIK